MRAGAHALSLLSVPLNVEVLRALAEEPRPLIDLRRTVGSPPQTTMRGRLRTLTELGVLEQRRREDFPGSVDYELGRPGRDLLELATVVQAWLEMVPGQPLILGSSAAKNAIKALVEGWTSTLIRALAARPLALTELDRLISTLNYPSLERRLGAMRLAGLIEARPSRRRGTPYTVTPWLQNAVAPIIAGALWERRHQVVRTAVPLTQIDVEATFLLAVPLLRLPSDLSGVCRLVVELPGADHKLAGVLISVREGKIESRVSRLGGDADAWVSGSVSRWLQTVVRPETDQLESGGDCPLAMAIVEGLHEVLFEAKASLQR